VHAPRKALHAFAPPQQPTPERKRDGTAAALQSAMQANHDEVLMQASWRSGDRAVSVTGAGGSLGRALIARLASVGIPVKGLVRTGKAAAHLQQDGATPVIGDLRNAESLATLFEGTDVAFHLAAWIMHPFDPQLARAINVDGTRDVIRAAAKAGCKRVVFASSIAVYGPKLEGACTEETAPWSVGDPYSDTKAEAEKVAREEAKAAGIELVILRPSFIYGPASPPWTVGPFKLISKGVPVVIGDGNDVLDAVYVDDVARAFEHAGFEPKAAGETFNIGGQVTTWNEFIGHYARMAGVKMRRLPAGIARFGTRAGAFVSRMFGRRPRVIPEMVGVMTSRATFPSDKAKRLLGYQPQVSLEEGMARTRRWLREAGLLKRSMVVLVTGAASGLGRATARELHRRGLEVWATDLRLADLQSLRDEGMRTLAIGVSSDASVRDGIAAIERVSGSIDVVINVAGIMRPGPVEVQSLDEFQAQFEVNALGPIRVARAVSPAMRRRGGGRIVNVSSTNGFISTPFMGSYAGSKHALEAYSDALRMELKPWGVDVVVVQPAAMNTGIAARARHVLRAAYANESTGWGPYMDYFINSNAMGDQMAEPVERMARTVVKVALSKKSVSRVRALQAKFSKFFSLLPSALTDRVLGNMAGLNRPEARLSQGKGGWVAALPER
jgi:nucleoside-diphosphate-sugar epimerase